jgi:Asp-tRNA(Asn)/Glu-tRNA(Gln) amidotransferase A subunit family amidase
MSTQLPQYGELDAATIARLVRARELSCVEVVGAANETIERHDGVIRAFAAQAGATALARARELDRLSRERASRMPLLGVPVAVADTFDTADLPTAYGSPIYRDHRPPADAALVSLLRSAGAVVVGKAKTAEFACLRAPDTRNPLDPARTPGGSSSGSAAAVAARLVPLATGSQSAGSVVHSASYCGVLGLKPTFGVVPLAGALPTSATLDTAGLFARSVDDLELALTTVGAAPAGSASARAGRALDGAGNGRCAASSTPRIALLRLAWPELEPQARDAIERYVLAAEAAGARIEEAQLPVAFERLVAAQRAIERAEKAHTLGPEVDRHGDGVSAELRAYLAEARSVACEDYLAARRLADEQRWRWHERLAAFDAALAPSTLGVPPAGLEQTGDPLLCRPFTLLGVPALALPGAWTFDGLPVGLQLAGVLHADRRVLAVARWLRAHVSWRAADASASANGRSLARAAE